MRPAAVISAAVAVAAGCGTLSPSVTVPVLWPAADTTGVSHATVQVAAGSGAPVQVIPTLGGRDWRVPAWNGAAAGLLLAGGDPHDTSIVVKRDGPGGGRSTTAVVAAATWAGLSGTALPATATLVGDVLPNGALIATPGTAALVRRAPASGPTPIVVPPGSAPVPGRTAVAATLSDAVDLLADVPPPEPAPPPAEDPELQQLVTIAAGQIIGQVKAVAADAPPPVRHDLRIAARRAGHELAAGAPYAAYATITLSQQQAEMAAAAAAVDGPLPREQRRLDAALRRQRRAVTDRVDLAASTPLNHLEQYPALADALTWGTGTIALLDLAEAELTPAATRADLRGVAQVLARTDYRLRTYLALQVEAVEQVGRVPVGDPAATLAILDGYAEVFAGAADASLPDLTGAAGESAQRAQALHHLWRRLPADDTKQEPTLTRLAAAVSYYVITHYALLTEQVTHADTGSRTLRRQVAVATGENEKLAVALAAAGLDPSYTMWGNRWGLAWARPQPGLTTDPIVRGTGLTYQWYATVQGRLLTAVAP